MRECYIALLRGARELHRVTHDNLGLLLGVLAAMGREFLIRLLLDSLDFGTHPRLLHPARVRLDFPPLSIHTAHTRLSMGDVRQ